MSANQRRPGFRLPWVASEGGNPAETPDQPTAGENEGQQTDASASDDAGTAPEPTTEPEAAASAPSAEAPTATVAPSEADTPEGADEAQSPDETTESSTFLNELVAAMRRVAEQARESGLSELKGRADELVSHAQSASAERATELRSRADADVAEVGEWAKREAERIREEAERRVAERRTKLDGELATETRRAEQEAKAFRIRVAEYERQLEGYYTRLAQIDDPAAFAAAAKRIPRPPQLGEAGGGDEAPGPEPADAEPAEEALAAAAAPETLTPVPMGEAAQAGAATPDDSGQPSPGAGGEAIPEAPATAVAPESQEPDEEGNITTSVVVTGLASFGAITGFRQSLAGVDGVRSVQLSLGPTGEFLYRAAHNTELDLADAIGSLEGEAAKVERDPNGTLRVVINRAR